MSHTIMANVRQFGDFLIDVSKCEPEPKKLIVESAKAFCFKVKIQQRCYKTNHITNIREEYWSTFVVVSFLIPSWWDWTKINSDGHVSEDCWDEFLTSDAMTSYLCDCVNGCDAITSLAWEAEGIKYVKLVRKEADMNLHEL